MNSGKILLIATLFVLTGSAWGIGNPTFANTPYYDISTQKPKILKENSSRTGQISAASAVNFFEVDNNALGSKNPFPIADMEIEFSCPQASTDDVSKFGWYISTWKHYADSTKPDEQLKGYNEISAKKCSDKFSMIIDQNDDYENEVASYYIGVQSACVQFPTMTPTYYYVSPDSSVNKPETCDTSDYQLKLGAIPKNVVANTNTLTAMQLQNATQLGSVKSGQINTNNDNNVYIVESNGSADIPLLFSCSSMAARQTNDWTLTVYDNKNTLVAGYPTFINGSDCGSGFVNDQGGYSFTLPKGSPSYYVSIKSACDPTSTNCTVDTSEYSIARDVTKVYTGVLAASVTNSSNFSFRLNRCGLNDLATVGVRVANVNKMSVLKNKTPINIQIGTMACQILTTTPTTPADSILGNITGSAEINDYNLTAKDNATVTLGGCGSTNSTITLTGTKLDLENLNPSQATTTTTTSTGAVVIPFKVDIGDFHCEAKDAFYINTDTSGVTNYSNHLPTDIIDSSPPVDLGAYQNGQITSAADLQLYYVDSSVNNDTKLNFSCNDSKRFNNDWKVIIYNSDKTLNGTPYVINGSDCATGQTGDNGAYTITIPKVSNSVRYYVAVKSACEPDDNFCIVDKSTYTLSRVINAVSPTTPTVTIPHSFDTSWLSSKKNLGAGQTGQIKSASDMNIYQVDTGTADVNLTFNCPSSIRYQNDWKVLIYDNTQTLQSTTLINGSVCGTGKAGDTGTYPILLSKNYPSYYLVVQSACNVGDSTCAVDSSPYLITRVTAAQAAATATTAASCLIGNCTTSTVKPFFN